jgi:hypothetical protein
MSLIYLVILLKIIITFVFHLKVDTQYFLYFIDIISFLILVFMIVIIDLILINSSFMIVINSTMIN